MCNKVSNTYNFYNSGDEKKKTQDQFRTCHMITVCVYFRTVWKNF